MRNTVINLGASVLNRIAIIIQTFRFLSVSNWQQNIVSFLSILVLVSIVSCKKDKGIFNLEWQNESLSLTAEICTKYRECADKEWKSIPENLKKFTEGRLEESQCQKRFRESNAYKLIGADPLTIQTTYKECHSQLLKFSCKDLQEGKMETIPSCVLFQKIQSGN
ncbi:LA_2478/LA_2722/LA_4182 family protein [Leptospira terpstrae]|uniref:LA_2478/LA_2722/LA_4182 family protein n=1 Tax=Leptospira terpstrae TaxID=293075 RepID=UPI003CFDBBF3